jgi:DNA-binding transcriptional regulator YdaS (Cro superfamily)
MAEKSKALKRAIVAAGKAETLASELGISPQALSQWETVPPLRVLDVERITGVPRYELRPDIYPVPSNERGAA